MLQLIADNAGLRSLLLLLLFATVAWGIIAHLQTPYLFDRGELTLGHATVATWVIDVALMAGATLLALFATIRGIAARSASDMADSASA